MAALPAQARGADQGGDLLESPDVEKLEDLAAQGPVFGDVEAVAPQLQQPFPGLFRERGVELHRVGGGEGAVLLQRSENAVLIENAHADFLVSGCGRIENSGFLTH